MRCRPIGGYPIHGLSVGPDCRGPAHDGRCWMTALSVSGARAGLQVPRFPDSQPLRRHPVALRRGRRCGESPRDLANLKTWRSARPRGGPSGARAGGAPVVPSAPEWPPVGRSRRGHGSPTGPTPRVASGAREVRSQEGRRDSRGGAFAWAGIPMCRIGLPDSRARFSAHPIRSGSAVRRAAAPGLEVNRRHKGIIAISNS